MNQPATILRLPVRQVKKPTPVKIMIRPEEKVLLDLLANIFITKIIES